MHSSNLIINARDRLHWHVRLSSDTLTAMMWGGWLYLWRPVVHAIILFTSYACAGAHINGSFFINCLPPMHFESSIIAVLSTAAALLLWTLLPAKRAKISHRANSLHDYAQHFNLQDDDITTAQNNMINVVHHNEHGQITAIECR